MSEWYRWDKVRERALWKFFGRWLLSPFVGFRGRFETTAYYLTIAWGVVGRFLMSRLGDLSLTQEELLWGVPSLIAVVIGAYRFVLFPANEVIKSHLAQTEGVTLEIESVAAPVRIAGPTTDSPKRWTIPLFVRINNSGAPTSLSGWQATIVRNGVDAQLQPVTIANNAPLATGGTFGPSDDIMLKSVNSPVATGAIVRGVLLCETDEATARAPRVGASFRVSCVDVRGVARNTPPFLWTGRHDEPARYPGLGTPTSIHAEGSTSTNAHGPSSPRVSAAWDGHRLRLRNDGATTAYNVEAIMWINDYYAIRCDPQHSITPSSGGEITVALYLDNGPRTLLESLDHAVKFFRLAIGWDTDAQRMIRKQIRDMRYSIVQLSSFDPLPPDVEIIFNVTYNDYEGHAYSTPHVLTYRDDKKEIRVRLATAVDIADADAYDDESENAEEPEEDPAS